MQVERPLPSPSWVVVWVKGLDLDGDHLVLEQDPVVIEQGVSRPQRLAIQLDALNEIDGALARIGDGQSADDEKIECPPISVDSLVLDQF